MKLSQLLRQVTYQVVKGTKDREIQGLKCDSRLVEKGDVFVCIKGYETDGHRFLTEALKRGAAAVIVQESCPKCREQKRCFGCCVPAKGVTVVSVSDTRSARVDVALAAPSAVCPERFAAAYCFLMACFCCQRDRGLLPSSGWS